MARTVAEYTALIYFRADFGSIDPRKSDGKMYLKYLEHETSGITLAMVTNDKIQ